MTSYLQCLPPQSSLKLLCCPWWPVGRLPGLECQRETCLLHIKCAGFFSFQEVNALLCISLLMVIRMVIHYLV